MPDDVTSEFQQAFGRRLKQLRVIRGLTQREFAAEAGLSATFLGQLERGVRGVNISYLPKLATAAQVRVQELIPRLADKEGLPK